MPNKIPALIAGLSTFIILILLAVLSVFTQIIVLNGANESQAFNAMGISLICQSVGLLFAVILACWLTRLFITKFNWNTILAVGVAILTGTLFGGFLAALAAILSIPLAGIS